MRVSPVHALLHDDPFAVVGDDEAVEVKVEPVLNGGAVYLGDEPARLRQRRAVEADALADVGQLRRGLAGMAAPAAADMEPQFARERAEPALERADHAGGDSRRMPVHAHDGAKRLEPERMRQPAQEFVAAVMMDDRLGDDRAQFRHALAEPGGNPAIVKRQIGAARPSSHESSRERKEDEHAPAPRGAQVWGPSSRSLARREWL